MFNLLVVWATSWELKVIKSKIKTLNLPLKVDFLLSGMWNYSVIYSLTQKLLSKNYDFVVNIGVCWFRGKYPQKLYQIANIINFCSLKELIVPTFFEYANFVTVISGEKPMKTSDVEKIFKKLNFESDVCLDMESYGIEFVCDKFNIPRLILKVPIDTSDSELEKFDYVKALDFLKGNVDYQSMLEHIYNFLVKTVDENEVFFENLTKNLNLTFSQKQKLKTYFRKIVALYWKEVFLKEYKTFLKDKKITKEKINNFISYLGTYY